MDTPRPALKSALSAVIALIALSVLMSSWYTVDEGERMVILRNGAAIDTAEPGLHFKIPVIDRAVPISVQTLKVEFGEMASYSKDQQPAVHLLHLRLGGRLGRPHFAPSRQRLHQKSLRPIHCCIRDPRSRQIWH